MKQIKIMCGDIELKAELNDKPTAKKIYGILPVNSRGTDLSTDLVLLSFIPIRLESQRE